MYTSTGSCCRPRFGAGGACGTLRDGGGACGLCGRSGTDARRSGSGCTDAADQLHRGRRRLRHRCRRSSSASTTACSTRVRSASSTSTSATARRTTPTARRAGVSSARTSASTTARSRPKAGSRARSASTSATTSCAATTPTRYQTPFLGNGTNLLTLPSNWVRPVVPQVNATSGNFRGLSPTTGLAPVLVNGVLTQSHAGAAGGRQRHHRERRARVQQSQSRHDAQGLFRRVQLQHRSAVGGEGLGEPDAAERAEAAQHDQPRVGHRLGGVAEPHRPDDEPVQREPQLRRRALVLQRRVLRLVLHEQQQRDDVREPVRQGHVRDDEHRPKQRVQPVHAEGRLQLLADDQARAGRVVRPQHAERPV